LPWRAETFKFSTDPELVAKVTDVIGLSTGEGGGCCAWTSWVGMRRVDAFAGVRFLIPPSEPVM
jgi:hypothetical protein